MATTHKGLLKKSLLMVFYTSLIGCHTSIHNRMYPSSSSERTTERDTDTDTAADNLTASPTHGNAMLTMRRAFIESRDAFAIAASGLDADAQDDPNVAAIRDMLKIANKTFENIINQHNPSSDTYEGYHAFLNNLDRLPNANWHMTSKAFTATRFALITSRAAFNNALDQLAADNEATEMHDMLRKFHNTFDKIIETVDGMAHSSIPAVHAITTAHAPTDSIRAKLSQHITSLYAMLATQASHLAPPLDALLSTIPNAVLPYLNPAFPIAFVPWAYTSIELIHSLEANSDVNNALSLAAILGIATTNLVTLWTSLERYTSRATGESLPQPNYIHRHGLWASAMVIPGIIRGTLVTSTASVGRNLIIGQTALASITFLTIEISKRLSNISRHYNIPGHLERLRGFVTRQLGFYNEPAYTITIDRLATNIEQQLIQLSINEATALQENQCAICYEHNAYTLPCRHVFHPKCLAQWIINHPFCPICRCSLKDLLANTRGNNAV